MRFLYTFFPYGIDAPYTLLWSLIGVLIQIPAAYFWLYVVVVFFPTSTCLYYGTIMGAICGILGSLYPVISVLIGSMSKPRVRDWMFEHISLQGDEHVLDVGCGSGLMLIGAAKRVPRGKAVGIDIWDIHDQYGANEKNVWHNAVLNNVADRIEVVNADARALPFQDKTFDLVVSSWVVHNIKDKDGRAKALAEMCRVVKKNGIIAIIDIQKYAEYQAWFEQYGFRVKKYGPRYTFGLTNWLLIVRLPDIST